MNLTPRDVFNTVDISEIRKMNALAGENTLNLGIGQLPNDLSQNLLNKGLEGFTKGFTRYTSNQGDLELRREIAKYHSNKATKDILPEQIVVTNGAEGAIWNIFYTYLNPLDEVLFPEISFSVYSTISQLMGAKGIPFKLKDDFSINFKDLELKITKKTKFVVINSPNNPTGAALDIEQIEKLVDLSNKYGFYIISDEIYSQLYFNNPPASPLSYSNKVIVVDGISKSAAATGLRIGWSLSSVEIAKPMIVANQYISTCATSTSQYAAREAFSPESLSFVANIRSDLREKGLFAYNLLSKIDNVKVQKPVGAFYIFPDISYFGKSKEVAKRILDEKDVLTIPGIAFGDRGDNHIRISFAVEFSVLEDALNKIKDLFDNWR